MIWLAWRQHRGQAAAGAALLGGYGLLALLEHGSRRFSGITTSVSLYLPLLLGMFWGAPLLARELEHGTHQLAWTQSVTRRRWLQVRLAVVGASALLATAALTALVTWGVDPYDGVAGRGRLLNEYFESHGLVPFAYTLLAVALGTLAGVLLRRVVWAMGATLAAVFTLRLAFETARAAPPAPLAGRFWALQGAEAGAHLVLAVALLALAFWWTVRRAE
jgi:hypothetical protein